MATVSSLGSGSGLDLESLVTKLMQAEQQPLTNLVSKEAKLQGKISALGTLKSSLSTFQSSVQTLTDSSKFQQATASVSDSEVATVSASSTAQTGSYSLEVTQLAVAHKLKSAAYTNTTDEIGTGTLSIQFGTYSGGVFTANPDKAAASITISSSQNTLSGVRDAINAAGAGVTASIVNDGSGNRLVLTSTSTGESSSMRITATDGDGNNTDNSGLSELVYDASTGGTSNLSQVLAAKNAQFTLDGMSITKSSNTVTDVISGMTINLLQKTDTDTPVTISVSRDTSTVTKAVQDFVKAYNTLNTSIKDLGHFSYNKDTKVTDAGALQGEYALSAIQSQLRNTLNGVLSGGGTYTRLSQVGVTFQKDGSLAVDTSKLGAAVKSNAADVASLFSANGVPTDSGITYAGAGDNTTIGNYTVNITQLATKGTLNGAAITVPVTIDSNNDSLKFKIDGVQSNSITLSEGSYTGAQLAAEMQSKINGDTALKASSVTVAVTWNSTSNRLEIVSNRYGSASTVEISSLDTNTTSTLGLSMGAGTDGLDVAGTIGGTAATGSGQTLTSSEGTATGLKLKVEGTITGYRGTIAFNRGFAYQLNKVLDSMLSSSGSISARVDGLNASVKQIDSQMERLSTRLEATEKRYRAQFTALDTTIATMKSTSTYLTQQLASLASLSGYSSS